MMGSNTLESSVQARLMRKAQGMGWYAMKTVGQSRNGFPDVFLAKHGHVVLVEVKTLTGVESHSQVREARKLTKAKVDVWVVYGNPGVDTLLRHLEDIDAEHTEDEDR